MARLFVFWALVALLLGAPAALAQDEPKTAEPAPAGADTPLLHGKLGLSVKDAIAMGVENNLNVQVERHQPYIAEQRASSTWGSYDPEFFAEFDYSDIDMPSATGLIGLGIVNERTAEGETGIRGLIPKVGASYDLSFSGSDLRSGANFRALKPEYRNTLTLSGNLPLMKDFLWSEPWFQVKSTRILSEEAYQNFRRALMDTIQSIEQRYWDLVAAEEQLRVAEKSVETSKALLEQTEAQYEVGVVSRVEVVEAEAGVAQFDFERITAENRYRRAQDDLIDVVLGRNLQPSSRLEIDPTDAPEPIAYDVNPDSAAALAFELRPELAAQRRQIERLEVQTKFTRNQKLPRLALRGSFGYSGLDGKGQETFDPTTGGTTTPSVSGRFFDASDRFFTSNGAQQWSIGGVFSIPLGNRTASANANVAQLELRRAKTQLLRVEQDVILEIRDAIRNLRSAQDGIEAAEARRLATAEQLRAERIRLENGESTPFDVLLREDDFFDAESQKIAALQIYRNSLAALDRAQGTILRTRNVVVDQALALR
jgi:outer membrane protein TolC